MIRKSILVSVVFLLVLSSLAVAEDVEGAYCETDVDCLILLGEGYTCNLLTGNCAIEETPTEEETATEETNQELLDAVNSLDVRVNSLELADNSLQQQLNSINSNLLAISSKLNDIDLVKNEINSMAVGLAVLQNELNKTSTGLGTIEEDLEKKSSRNKIFLVVLFLLIIGALFLGYNYYKKKKLYKLDPKTHKYITKHIKEGKKFPEIKSILKAAGWVEEEIKWAYKETIKKNYQNYIKRSKPTPITKTTKKAAHKTSTQKSGYDKNKAIAIAVVSILLIGGVIFLLSGTTGQAVKIQKLVDGKVGGESGVVTYEVTCTPPHTLNPAGDGCCLDIDANKVCDYLEEQEKVVGKVDTGAQCTDNLQCQQGDLCINSQCKALTSLYSQQICETSCSYYSVKVKAIYSSGTEEKVSKECKTNNHCNDYITETGDKCLKTHQGTFCVHKPLVEVYDLKPKQGSYGAAGALEWKIMESPAYCTGEQAIVPIKITRKKQKEILSEEVITLNEREISESITHPLYDGFSFKLKVEKIGKPVGC